MATTKGKHKTTQQEWKQIDPSISGQEQSGRRPRLPERNDEILAEGSKLKFVLNAKSELEVLGNRLGLRALAAICSGLSESIEDDHYHLDENFWGTEPGSIPVVVYRFDKL
jgi:hypothetical protein